MGIFSIFLTVAGLVLFETISSIDNAIINAQVLSTTSRRARVWFTTWGLFFAVFVVRGLLPFVIVWIATPNVGPGDAFMAVLSSDPSVRMTIQQSAPILLLGGGTFLLFLFFHWLFLQPKNISFRAEMTLQRLSLWFYAIVSILLAFIVWFALKINPILAFSAVVGSTAFFIVHGFSENAAQAEEELYTRSNISDIQKILYLEVIDAAFSIDGVMGAFAFTLSVPLILIGNGIGALVIRQLTVSHINHIQKYLYLKNGAMYSIFFLGLIMTLDAFGLPIPDWLSPVITFVVVGFFFLKSRKELAKVEKVLIN